MGLEQARQFLERLLAKPKRAVVVATIVALAPAGAAHAANGGLDLNSWCARHYPASYSWITSLSPGQATVAQNNVYGWTCTSWSSGTDMYGYPEDTQVTRGGIDMMNACQEQYGYQAVAHWWDFNNPYTWYCTY